MFSHIAEETTRLSHGFLGALFSTILVYTNESALAISTLCFGLFGIFVINSIGLHLLFKSRKENKSIYAIYSTIAFTCVAAATCSGFVGYTVRDYSFFKLLPTTYTTMLVGLSVYIVFLLILNVTHIAAIIAYNHDV